MSEDLLVTIGIPTYNRADSYFPDALRCALNQSYSNIEIIVSDNCSTDSTEAIVKSYDDPRIRYIKQKTNIPPTDNFNFIIEQARGDYFSILHDDDLIDEDYIETCMKAADGHKDFGLIRTGLRWIDDKGKTITQLNNVADGLSLEEFFLAWFRGSIPMHQPCTLFNTQNLRDIGGFNSRHQLFNDVKAEVMIAASSPRLDIPDIKASYRHHPVRTTTATSIRYWCEDSLELFDVMRELVSGPSDVIQKEGARFFVRHNVRLTRQITSSWVQLKSYWTIYRCFHQPVSFLMKNVLYLMKRSIRKHKEA